MQKIFLNYDQQIEKLKNEKNLLIDNEAYAKEIYFVNIIDKQKITLVILPGLH